MSRTKDRHRMLWPIIAIDPELRVLQSAKQYLDVSHADIRCLLHIWNESDADLAVH
jgi:hypothetical protein